MAEESYRKRLRDEGTCTICLDFFKNPVTLDCGHSFCRTCITRSWEAWPDTCPQCRGSLSDPRRLGTNRQLANLAQIAKELNARPAVCEHHQEPLQLFCVVCDRSRECQAHHLGPVGASVQDQICHFLEILREERENILSYKRENEKETQDLLERLQAERGKPAATISQLCQFLEEQKKFWQAQMVEVEKEIVGRRDKYQSTLFAELSTLAILIQELEEKQQLSADELPQNLGNILERCKRKSFVNTEAFPWTLKGRIHGIPDLNSFLEAKVKKFQDTLRFRFQFQKEKVTFDPDTACPDLVVFEDGKNVRWEAEEQDLPYKPERFDELSIVLGREGFTSGCHFWEVSVADGEDEEDWAVGVARKSVMRKGDTRSDLEGVWDFANSHGVYKVCTGRTRVYLSFLNQELYNIRVTLNYEEGQVAFFNANTDAHLYTYSGAEFRGETILPYFYLGERGFLTLLY